MTQLAVPLPWGALLLFFTLTACQEAAEPSAEDRPPNIIFILADDLGYGDLGVTGQQKFETPHLDRLAAEGMLFTQHYAGSTVCAPSRSALMTGRHTGHTFVRGNRRMEPEGQYPLADSIFTLPEMLQQAGYATGAFGKWGLGPPGSEGDPINQGFDAFFGYNCQTLAHNYYPDHLWDGPDRIELPQNDNAAEGVYAPMLIHQRALSFIERYKDQPFFLYVPSTIPHAELKAPDAYMEEFKDEFPPGTPYAGVDDGPEFRQGPYGSQEEPRAAFAAMVTLLDEQVGEIIDKVDSLGLAENTLIIFSSDNGPHLEGGADPDFFDSNGIFRGYKRDLYEGGIRVPTIARWPGQVAAGSRSDHISAFWDFMPTFAQLAGAEMSGPPRDGISLVPTLLGEGGQVEHEYLYWEFHERGGRVAVRKGDWKGVRYNIDEDPASPLELYDLANDPGEEENIADKHPDVVGQLDSIVQAAHIPSDIFVFQADN